MARKLKNHDASWTKEDLRTLKELAKTTPAKLIAKTLDRTEGAVRYKASINGISLQGGRAPKKKVAAKKKAKR